jgi:hypothetical protein
MTQFNYETIKRLAKENHASIKDFLVLFQDNDPFYVGRPAAVGWARWFTDLWHRFGYSTGIHLRRIHYQSISQDPPIRTPDGRFYQNTVNCWKYLENAGKWARYLGMIDPDAFIDRRNPEAIINANWDQWENPEPSYRTEGAWNDYGFDLPALPELGVLPDELPELPRLKAGGYEGIQQDYHVEVWAEKSTMNDVLEPICREYHVNLITGLGELSITAVRLFLKRVARSERPARILYISDFDPSGENMPVSVARKIEFYHRNEYPGLDIALQPIILTYNQVEFYRLPGVPFKNKLDRDSHFRREYGKNAVELDALQALHPGELARIVTEAIMQYYDPELENNAQELWQNLQGVLNDQDEAVKMNYYQSLDELAGDYKRLRDEFEETRATFTELIKDFKPNIDAYRERLETIKQRAKETYTVLRDELDAVAVDLDDYPLPDPDIDGDPDDLLYASERDYIEQLEAYKNHK